MARRASHGQSCSPSWSCAREKCPAPGLVSVVAFAPALEKMRLYYSGTETPRLRGGKWISRSDTASVSIYPNLCLTLFFFSEVDWKMRRLFNFL